jgi:hypothetical protein
MGITQSVAKPQVPRNPSPPIQTANSTAESADVSPLNGNPDHDRQVIENIKNRLNSNHGSSEAAREFDAANKERAFRQLKAALDDPNLGDIFRHELTQIRDSFLGFFSMYEFGLKLPELICAVHIAWSGNVQMLPETSVVKLQTWHKQLDEIKAQALEKFPEDRELKEYIALAFNDRLRKRLHQDLVSADHSYPFLGNKSLYEQQKIVLEWTMSQLSLSNDTASSTPTIGLLFGTLPAAGVGTRSNEVLWRILSHVFQHTPLPGTEAEFIKLLNRTDRFKRRVQRAVPGYRGYERGTNNATPLER